MLEANGYTVLPPNVQIEGLADHKTWPEPRKFKTLQAVKSVHTASPSRMQGRKRAHW